jgi:hypothetical protein
MIIPTNFFPAVNDINNLKYVFLLLHAGLLHMLSHGNYDQYHCGRKSKKINNNKMIDNIWCLAPLSAIFHLYHGDEFS